MNISLPKFVKTALDTIEANGFECYCVGGAIRDLILGKTPFDFDITTNASPDNIMQMFEHTVPTGLKHGTVTVIIDGHNIEVTTYRTEFGYSDHRSPDSVGFIGNVEDDVMRRDFTMNTILYNPKTGIYDPQNGLKDIEKQLIRAVGVAGTRFNEDALRIMRAFRFSAQLGFDLEADTLTPALELTDSIKLLSRERIFGELKKIISSDFPYKADALFKSGAFEFLGLNVKTSLEIISSLDKDFALRFGFLCFKNSLDPKQILKELKADNETINECEKLVSILKSPVLKSSYDLKVILNRFGIEALEKLLNCGDKILKNSTECKLILKDIVDNNEPYKIQHLKINGNDLKVLNLDGERIGTVLLYLLNQVMISPTLNNCDDLIKLATEYCDK